MVSKKIAIACLGFALVLGFGVVSPGCGEAPPPEISATDFEAAKQKQEDIMARERGVSAGKAKKSDSH